MPRTSAFRNTWQPNKRPYLVLTPDAYVSIQGETSVIACGECKREVNLNRYLTGIQTNADVNSPPSSATVTLSIPDNDVNQFYVDGVLIIIEMMEIEIFAKGYFTVGGFPQYYRIFWGMISTVSKNWSNGVTTITITCKDILRWWQITNITLNSAFLDASKSMGGWSKWQNRFAGTNPYAVIIALAKESMGDFSITNSSFMSYRPEDGPERRVIAQYAKDIMVYWQLKFGNLWNNLVLYGTSGQAYTFSGDPGNVSPVKIANQIFKAEDKQLNLNPETSLIKIQPFEIAAYKRDITRYGDVNLFQNEIQSKLSVALTARDQAGAYEFYCDTTGDIVFKPPFYNLNVLPNKPVSWIQDFEIMGDSITTSEQEVFTHITSSGHAFGGVTDWGLNDEITTPRTGVIDWHLLRRYGWRRLAVQLEWAGNPRKLFYYLLDYMDRINSRITKGSITIPLRPELRIGFPVWVPKYDSFFYLLGISHNYSSGGQATSVLTLTAQRKKFIAPKNIGSIVQSGIRTTTYTDPKTKKKTTRKSSTYSISFPSDVGETSGLTTIGQEEQYGGPAIIRDAKTGKLLGFPNAVMVYRSTLSGNKLVQMLQKSGSKKGHNPTKQDKKRPEGPKSLNANVIRDVFVQLQNDKRAEIIDRLRIHRYEAGMSNAGAYDYAHDVKGSFKEFAIIPTHSILWGTGTTDPDGEIDYADIKGATSASSNKERIKMNKEDAKIFEAELPGLRANIHKTDKYYKLALKNLHILKRRIGGKTKGNVEVKKQEEIVSYLRTNFHNALKKYSKQQQYIKNVKSTGGKIKRLTSLDVMIRPVSDEFGFEVIGHNRYGRGAFMDRGHVQLSKSDSSNGAVNKLNIQFASTGGLLTEKAASNLRPESQDFAKAFEQMMPDDYMTGASFKGDNYNGDKKLEQVNHTNQQTYVNLMNNSPKGHSVFAEADALKRAVTLAELKPTMKNGLDQVGFEKCSCELGRTDWLSVLPQTFIQQILRPTQTSVSSMSNEENKNTITTADGDDFSLDSSGSFFDVLRTYLVSRFNSDYKENMLRENYNINGGIDVTIPDLNEQDDVLRPQGNSLFDRAASGDPDALKSLQNGANFNFGKSKKALDHYKDTVSIEEKKLNKIGSSLSDMKGSIFNALSGGLVTVGADGKLKPTVSAKVNSQQHQPPEHLEFPLIANTVSLTSDK